MLSHLAPRKTNRPIKIVYISHGETHTDMHAYTHMHDKWRHQQNKNILHLKQQQITSPWWQDMLLLLQIYMYIKGIMLVFFLNCVWHMYTGMQTCRKLNKTCVSDQWRNHFCVHLKCRKHRPDEPQHSSGASHLLSSTLSLYSNEPLPSEVLSRSFSLDLLVLNFVNSNPFCTARNSTTSTQ